MREGAAEFGLGGIINAQPCSRTGLFGRTREGCSDPERALLR